MKLQQLYSYVRQAIDDYQIFLHKYNLPLVKNPCPADGETKREYVKQLVRQINLENPGVKKRIFHAICTGRIEGWNINGKP